MAEQTAEILSTVLLLNFFLILIIFIFIFIFIFIYLFLLLLLLLSFLSSLLAI